MKRITAFDVETPNGANDRICSIALVQIEDGHITQTFHSYVNPEEPIHRVNMQIHGITENDVKNAPIFPEIWNEICSYFADAIVVAHNAQFDLSVLRKVLSHYKIDIKNMPYVCTKRISEDHLPLGSYTLPNICNHLGIPLYHHNALSDALSCAKIICRFMQQGIDLSHYVQIYDFHTDYTSSATRHSGSQLSETSKSLASLKDFIAWLTSDENLSEESVFFLYQWMEQNQDLQGNYPYDKIYDKLNSVLIDGILDAEERRELIELFNCILNPLQDCSCDDNISVEGKTIVLSGDFDYGTKEELGEYLESKGATIKTSVSKKTNIVLVGNRGNDAWVAGNYGNKIKKALELQESGVAILIIREKDFFKESQ